MTPESRSKLYDYVMHEQSTPDFVYKEAEVRNEIPQFMKLVDYHLGDGA